MFLSEAPIIGDNRVITIDPKYRIILPTSDHILLVVGAMAGTAAAKFAHNNILCKQSRLLEFKHYRKGGGKFWTSAAGCEYFFIVPMNKIELDTEDTKGYSFVHVIINGVKTFLNVSGGGCEVWTDYVSSLAHVAIARNKKYIKAIADVALSPAQCRAAGLPEIDLEESELSREQLMLLHAKLVVRPALDAGKKIILDRQGVVDEFTDVAFYVIERVKNHWFAREGSENGSCFRIYDRHIDWTKTAEINGIEVPPFELWNKFGTITKKNALR